METGCLGCEREQAVRVGGAECRGWPRVPAVDRGGAMTQTDAEKFQQSLRGVYALYRADISPAVIAIWWNALKGYDLEAVVEALGRHAMNPDTGQFLPKPADVVKAIEGASADVALQAWAKVLEGLRRFGTYESVAFDDQIIHRVLTDLGGWVWLGRQAEKDMPFVEKRFRDAYRAWRTRGLGMTEPVRHLPGIVETHNAGAGHRHAIPAPKLIGAEKAIALTRAKEIA